VDVKAMSVFYQNDDDTYRAQTGQGFTPAQEVDASTVVGPEAATIVDGDNGTQYILPGGFNMTSLSIGVPQLTISGFKGTEATVRWVAFSVGDVEFGDISIFGLGVRHSISQYLDDFPLDLAAVASYHNTNAAGELLDATTFSIGGQGSIRLLNFLNAFGSLTYDSSSMTAQYTYDGGAGSEAVKVELPTATTLHATLGVGIEVLFFQLNLFGEMAHRPGASAGIGAAF
jgi:hypothetical protein